MKNVKLLNLYDYACVTIIMEFCFFYVYFQVQTLEIK